MHWTYTFVNRKRIQIVLFWLNLICCSLHAQSQVGTNGIFFQAVARDNYANPARDRKIYVQSNILQGSATGAIVLNEIHETSTDASGVFSINIGNGFRLGGTASNLASIAWSNGPFFLNLKISITPTAPSTNWNFKSEWIDLGTNAFGTVPYAMYSAGVFGMENKLNIADTAAMLSQYARLQNLQALVASTLKVSDSIVQYITPTQLKANSIDSTHFYNQLILKENSANKSTNILIDAISDTKYPTVKTVKDYVDQQIAAIAVADGSIVSQKLANSAVTTEKIADVSVTDAKIQSVSASKILGNFEGNASTATLSGNITATSNESLTSLAQLKTVGTITNGTWSSTAIDIAHGGTNAITAAEARTNLGLVIGTDILAQRTFGSAANNNSADFEPALIAGNPSQYLRGDKTWQILNTSQVPEVGNLYFTNTRVQAILDNWSATANIGGNANTATGLATGRTISTTGDITYTSGNFDGLTNITGVATLTNTTVIAGTYGGSTAIPILTIDAKGRITNATTNSIIAGVNTVNAIANSSNVHGATINGTSITLTPADANNGGVVTTNAQIFAGDKTFSGNISASTFIGNWDGSIIDIIHGGTGTNTLTGLVKANGTNPYSAAVSGVDYSLVREVSDEFLATAGQTSFTLSQTKSNNSVVKMYVNGIRISNTAYSLTGTTLAYNPANNGANILSANDRIQIDYYY